MECDICKITENRESFKFIYEDDKCFAILHESPAVPGHTMVIPKKHATVIEELDGEIAEHMFVVANKISTALFDSLGAHGTNLILNNGPDAGQELPHVILNVLPRKENDGLNLEWTPKKANDSELKTTASMMGHFSQSIYSGQNKLPETRVKKEEPKEDKKDEDDYLVKSLKRTP